MPHSLIRRTAIVLSAVVVGGFGILAADALGDGPPAGATALCKDGTYSFSATHSGSCSHHGGVAQWLDGGGEQPATTSTAAPTQATTTAAAPAATTAAVTTSAAPVAVTTSRTTTVAAEPVVVTKTARPVAIAKSCSAGYTHAVIAGAEKCLRAGEFCTHAYDSQYRRYGYRCIRFYANVQRYRLTHA